jgi:L-lactate dehydrogenase complex protein LldG
MVLKKRKTMTGARERILAEIKAAVKVEASPLQYAVSGIEYSNKKEQFMQMLKNIGGSVTEINNENEVEDFISRWILSGKRILSIQENEKINYPVAELYSIEVAILRGEVAVAENGAIWVPEKNMGNRVLPFACKELVLIIKAKNIVHNMHEAYDHIDLSTEGYGVFIAGPSKTADIEQSLVIGAHGPIDLLVIIIND